MRLNQLAAHLAAGDRRPAAQSHVCDFAFANRVAADFAAGEFTAFGDLRICARACASDFIANRRIYRRRHG